MTPCNYIHQKDGYTKDFVSDECIDNLEAQMKYLGPLNFLIYFNDEEFDQQGFGDESIYRSSKMMHYQFNEDTPVWLNYQLQTNML